MENEAPCICGPNLGCNYTKITGEEPAMRHNSILFAVTKCHLQFGKEGKVMPYEGVGKALYDHGTVMKVKGVNHFYCWDIFHLPTAYEDQHFCL